MSAVRKVSRSEIDLPNSIINDENLSELFELPDLEFDFIEVDNVPTVSDSLEHEVVEEDQDEFEFPLFNMSSVSTTKTGENDDDQSRGRTETVIKKISLRELSEERIIQSRPDSYYFSTTVDESYKAQILQSAISGEDVICQSHIPLPDSHPWRVIDLQEYNAKVIAIKQAKRRQRPGKKKRVAIIESRLRKLERLKVSKKLERELKKKLMKKIHHKRGGKKNKKPTTLGARGGGVLKQQVKLKYRTE